MGMRGRIAIRLVCRLIMGQECAWIRVGLGRTRGTNTRVKRILAHKVCLHFLRNYKVKDSLYNLIYIINYDIVK